jgi:murein DD-endopeptidase MepM/ murein hydrolase activator NlpD
MLKNTLPKLVVLTTGVITIGVAQVTFNSVAKADDFMNTYFRDGQIIKLVTPKGYNVNLPYATNGGMINTFEPDGTDDWKFVVVRTRNGMKFKRLNTNHIITSKNFPSSNLALLEAYNDVGGEDKYQTWIPIPSKSGFFNICLLAQQDQCMNVPRSTNRTKLTTYQRDLNDQDQWFSAVVLQSQNNSGGQNNNSGGQISLPFRSGQTWYVCQGYNGSRSHQNYAALDLTVAKDFGQNNACYAADSNVDKSTAQPILAPASGKILYINGRPDLVCLQLDAGRSILIGHMRRSVGNGQSVSEGSQLGTVAPSTDPNIGEYAHIHIEARKSSNCALGTTVPFTNAQGFQFRGVGDLPGDKTHWKLELRKP